MTVLVTGATGFVGSAVARAFLAAGHEVRALVRQGTDQVNVAGLNIDIVEGDLTDRASLVRAAQGCSGLAHVAADYRLWMLDPATAYRTNVDGTRDLMRAALEAGVSRIVYTSSVATLGLVRDGVADEDTPSGIGDMIGDYKRSKFLAEQGVRRLIEEEGVPAVIVNPSAPVGPRDVKPTPTGRLIRDAATGRMPAYVDTGLNVVHVDDVALGHVLAYAHGVVGDRYILGGDNLTLKQILETVARLAGRKPPRVSLPHGLILPLAHAAEAWGRFTRASDLQLTVDGVRMARKRMFFSSAKAERALGYRHRPAEDALRDAITWFLGDVH